MFDSHSLFFVLTFYPIAFIKNYYVKVINYLSSGLFPFRFYTLVQFVWVLKGILLRRVEDLNTRESGPEAPFSLSTVVYTSMSRIDPVKIKNVDFLDFLFLGHGEFVNL